MKYIQIYLITISTLIIGCSKDASDKLEDTIDIVDQERELKIEIIMLEKNSVSQRVDTVLELIKK